MKGKTEKKNEFNLKKFPIKKRKRKKQKKLLNFKFNTIPPLIAFYSFFSVRYVSKKIKFYSEKFTFQSRWINKIRKPYSETKILSYLTSFFFLFFTYFHDFFGLVAYFQVFFVSFRL